MTGSVDRVGNTSRALNWSGVPEGTKSFVLTVYDPDAPTGSAWWHWTVVNIPADAAGLAVGASPENLPAGAIQGRTDFGAPGFGGACPPEGAATHRDVCTLYVMPEASLPLDANALGAIFGYLAYAMALEQPVLTASFGRKACTCRKALV